MVMMCMLSFRGGASVLTVSKLQSMRKKQKKHIPRFWRGRRFEAFSRSTNDLGQTCAGIIRQGSPLFDLSNAGRETKFRDA